MVCRPRREQPGTKHPSATDCLVSLLLATEKISNAASSQLDTHQVARLGELACLYEVTMLIYSTTQVLPHAIGFLLGSIGVSYAIQAFSVRGTQLLSSVFWMTSALLLSLIPPFLLVWIATFGLTVGCGLTETLVSSLTGQLATSPRMLSVFWGIIRTPSSQGCSATSQIVPDIGCLSAPLMCIITLHVTDHALIRYVLVLAFWLP